MLADVCPGSCSGVELGTLVAAGGRLWFAGSDGPNNSEPWQSDGTARGTRLVRDIVPGGSSRPGLVHIVGGQIMFPANRSLDTPRQL